MYAPEIYSLWEADLAFVRDVAKGNDGVNYLLVVTDVLSKYVWVRPLKCVKVWFAKVLKIRNLHI